MILLFHVGMDSTITTPARLGREQHAPRHYRAEGHFLVLDGPGHIIAHDAEEICKIPGYRMATPQECDAYHARGRKASHVVEDGSGDEEEDETEQTSKTTAPTRGRRKDK